MSFLNCFYQSLYWHRMYDFKKKNGGEKKPYLTVHQIAGTVLLGHYIAHFIINMSIYISNIKLQSMILFNLTETKSIC